MEDRDHERSFVAVPNSFLLRKRPWPPVARTSVRIFTSESAIGAHSRARYRQGTCFRNTN